MALKGTKKASAGKITGPKKAANGKPAASIPSIDKSKFFDISRDIQIALNGEGVFIAANNAVTGILGWPVYDFVGKHFFEFVHPDDRLATLEVFNTRKSGATVDDFRNRNRCKDGSYRIMSWRSHGVIEKDGYILASGRDVTDETALSEEARGARDLLKAILDNSPSIILVKDLEGRYRFVNKAHEAVFGRKSETLNLKSVDTVLSKEAAEKALMYDRLALEAKGPVECELDIPQRDGIHTYLTVKFPLFGPDGSVASIATIATDITDRKSVERALRESERRLRAITTNVPDIITRMDVSGRITYINRLMPGQAEVVGTSIYRWVPETHHHVVSGALAAAIETGAVQEIETPGVSIGNEVRQFLMRIVSEAGVDAKSDAKGVICISTDVTERKKMEQSLAESRDTFRVIAEALDEVFWLTDESVTRTLYISPAYERVWGRTCESLYKNPMSFLDAVHPDDRPGVVSAIEALKTGVPFDIEYRIYRPDRSIRLLRDKGFPIKNAEGRVTRAAGVVRDITPKPVE